MYFIVETPFFYTFPTNNYKSTPAVTNISSFDAISIILPLCGFNIYIGLNISSISYLLVFTLNTKISPYIVATITIF